MSVLPDAVCWHEGMQLLPQHFQLQGLRAEALAARIGQACNPWFWGVTALELDPSALCAGQVRVLHLEAILPDGLPVSVQAGVDAPLEFDLETALAAAEGPLLNVHLAVSPLWRAGQLLPLKGRLQSRVGAPLPDLASGEHPEPITVWRASLRLVGDDGKADSVCLPLLRVAKEGGAYVSLPYVPPTPLILPESPLGRRVQSLCARAREKALFLGGRLRLAQQAGNQDDAVEIRRQLAALWTRLPEVEGLLASRTASPLALHGSLLGLAGAWAALDPLAGVPAFEALDFLDLRRGYEPLLDWLERAIESIRAGYRCLPFEQEEQVFSVRLPDPAPRQRLVVGLRMPAGAGEQAAADWLERAIVASDPHLPLLARQRMSGLPRQPMNRQEQVAYSVGDDTRLFVVQGAGDWFDAGQPLRIVAPVSGVASSPWQIVLFVADGSDNSSRARSTIRGTSWASRSRAPQASSHSCQAWRNAVLSGCSWYAWEKGPALPSGIGGSFLSRCSPASPGVCGAAPSPASATRRACRSRRWSMPSSPWSTRPWSSAPGRGRAPGRTNRWSRISTAVARRANTCRWRSSACSTNAPRPVATWPTSTCNA